VTSLWSDQARVLLHPFRGYEALAAEDAEPRRAIFERLFVLMLALGAFVSFTAAGRLVPLHVVSPTIAWAYVPLLQLAAIAIVRARFVRGERVGRVYALYLAGHGGWMLFLLSLAGVCLFAPDAPAALLWLLRTGIVPIVALLNFVWGIVLTFALFRRGLGLSRGTARAATSTFYAIYAGSIVSWFFFTGQLHTLFQG
jgi:hypothetical protein